MRLSTARSAGNSLETRRFAAKPLMAPQPSLPAFTEDGHSDGGKAWPRPERPLFLTGAEKM